MHLPTISYPCRIAATFRDKDEIQELNKYAVLYANILARSSDGLYSIVLEHNGKDIFENNSSIMKAFIAHIESPEYFQILPLNAIHKKNIESCSESPLDSYEVGTLCVALHPNTNEWCVAKITDQCEQQITIKFCLNELTYTIKNASVVRDIKSLLRNCKLFSIPESNEDLEIFFGLKGNPEIVYEIIMHTFDNQVSILKNNKDLLSNDSDQQCCIKFETMCIIQTPKSDISPSKLNANVSEFVPLSKTVDMDSYDHSQEAYDQQACFDGSFYFMNAAGDVGDEDVDMSTTFYEGCITPDDFTSVEQTNEPKNAANLECEQMKLMTALSSESQRDVQLTPAANEFDNVAGKNEDAFPVENILEPVIGIAENDEAAEESKKIEVDNAYETNSPSTSSAGIDSIHKKRKLETSYKNETLIEEIFKLEPKSPESALKDLEAERSLITIKKEVIVDEINTENNNMENARQAPLPNDFSDDEEIGRPKLSFNLDYSKLQDIFTNKTEKNDDEGTSPQQIERPTEEAFRIKQEPVSDNEDSSDAEEDLSCHYNDNDQEMEHI